MKKNFFIAAVAALALASCSNDEVVQSAQTSPENAIAFRTLMGNVTRAADQTATTLQAGDAGFFVTAMYKATAEATASTYFDDVQFTYDTSSNTYNSEKKYYWPASGTLDFFAYAPEIPSTSPQVSRTDYTTFVVTPSTTVSQQVDLIYANTDAKTKGGAYTPAGTSTASTFGAAGVPLNFRHTGSKIVVKVKNSENNNLTFEITGMKIVNVDGEATFEYDKVSTDGTTDGENDTQLVIGDWSDNTNAQTVTYSTTLTTNTINSQVTTAQFLNSSGVAGGVTPTEDESVNMILIPQTTPNTGTEYDSNADAASYTGSYIALKMVIKNGDTGVVVADASQDNVSSKNKWAMWPVKFEWVPGKKYTYVIDLANGGYWEINDDTDADLDPILDNALIKFVDVTVDDWSDYDYDGSAAGTQPIPVDGPTL